MERKELGNIKASLLSLVLAFSHYVLYGVRFLQHVDRPRQTRSSNARTFSMASNHTNGFLLLNMAQHVYVYMCQPECSLICVCHQLETQHSSNPTDILHNSTTNQNPQNKSNNKKQRGKTVKIIIELAIIIKKIMLLFWQNFLLTTTRQRQKHKNERKIESSRKRTANIKFTNV